ncbi:MAG TPA: hypothetical protein VK475_10695, partial [Pyrinomonadaceae bacterium]|nr:hypothetical protein [Pyrinomonadaceae bacterium]
MKLHTHLAFFVVLMAAVISGWCGNQTPPISTPTPTPSPGTAPARLRVSTEKEVTFYPTYGYRVGTGWNAQLRGWVHEDRKHEAAVAAQLLKVIAKCDDTQMNNVVSRSADLMDDNKKFEEVEVKFDFDPEDKAYP